MESPRKRRATETADALERIRELVLLARHNAPEPSYLDRPLQQSSACAPAPVLSERQREKVVRYINEVCLRSPRPHSPLPVVATGGALLHSRRRMHPCAPCIPQ